MTNSGIVPRPEHPRPDFERRDWSNLNGRWEFEIDEAGDGEQRGLTSGRPLAGSIVVPFCPESGLSGVGHTDFMHDVWYRRAFALPTCMHGKRVLLHFGAVDWRARVWVNGRPVGEHRGGYSSFSFEVTDLVRDGGNEIVVHAHDDTRSGLQATGKQSHRPESHGCHYTRTTGIWQTVWLEAVGDTYLREFVLSPDLDGGRLLFQGTLDGSCQDTVLRLRAYHGRSLVGEETVAAAWRNTLAVVPLSKITAWWPGKPFLYDLQLDLLQGGVVVDSVRTYFGLRKLTIEGNRFLINDRPIFQRLVLDQGFYPDGVYTAPSDDALRRDIEMSLAAGFNGARLHEKVFEPRLLYWADRLGYLVWGEYPSWGVNLADAGACADVASEWEEVVRRDRNHPAIIGWCPLNETDASAGVALAQQLLAVTRRIDPSRPYLDTSGYVHLDPDTDVYDCHDYDQDPDTFAERYAWFARTGTTPFNNNAADPRSRYRGQPYFVSEYGGVRLSSGQGSGAGWGYGETDLNGLIDRYRRLTDTLLDNPNMFGFCYTQLTDVEQEQNGIYAYDRSPKYDPALVRAVNQRLAAYETQPPRVMRIEWRSAAATSEQAAQEWRYRTDAPPEGWQQARAADADWAHGDGAFGAAGGPGGGARTEWAAPCLWLRRSFRLEDPGFEYAVLRVGHSGEALVYVNGHLVATLPGATRGYRDVEATGAVREALVAGDNVIAACCRHGEGAPFFDVGIQVGTGGTSGK